MMGQETTPRRLDSVVPEKYSLSISNIRFAPEWKFNGSVSIGASVVQSITEIRLHACALEVSSVRLERGTQDISNLCSSTTASDGVLCLQLTETLTPGDVTITIQYEASIGNSMSGFFRARYKALDQSVPTITDGDNAAMLATHFEPCYAREAFPCFDEPHLKATFSVDVEAPSKLTILSNMPAKETTELSGDKSGQKRVWFDETPVMSTYLLAWVVGDLEYIESVTKKDHSGSPVPVRVYAPPGLIKYADFALKCACDVLDLYKELFEIDYPIPKSDHVVVPEFVSGAMENWGLITYKPTKMLFDPETSNNRVQAKAAYVIAHELAHQWFGNLVTMQSWTELWLNEGFATWVGYLAVDRLYPEWNIWGQYLTEILDDVMKLDSLPTSHAIVTKVEDEKDAAQMFDQISYSKGASVIRMLAEHLGLDVFLKGLAAYLKKHAYQNASSEDLWHALNQASGVNVSGLMGSWIHTPAFPIVSIDSGDTTRIIQRSILAPRDSKESSQWSIPLEPTRATNGHSAAHKDPCAVINKAHVGYFCLDYDTKHLQKAIGPLESNDIIGLLCDLSTMVLNNVKPIGELMDFIWSIRSSKDGFVWLSISRSLLLLRSTFADDASILGGIKKFTTGLLEDIRNELRLSEMEIGYTQAELFKSLIGLGFAVDDQDIMRETRVRFEKWAAGDMFAFPPSLRGVILSSCVSNGGESEFEAVKKAFSMDSSLDGQEILLTAMASASDTKMAEKVLQFLFESDTVALQHLHLVGGGIGQNHCCRDTQWEYVKREWISVSSRLQKNRTCRDWWIEESLRHFSDPAVGDEIDAFFTEKLGASTKKPVDYVKACIRRNSAFKESAKGGLYKWLSAQKYM